MIVIGFWLILSVICNFNYLKFQNKMYNQSDIARKVIWGYHDNQNYIVLVYYVAIKKLNIRRSANNISKKYWIILFLISRFDSYYHRLKLGEFVLKGQKRKQGS